MYKSLSCNCYPLWNCQEAVSVKNFSGFLLTDNSWPLYSLSGIIIAAMFLARKQRNCILVHFSRIKDSKTNFSCKCFILFSKSIWLSNDKNPLKFSTLCWFSSKFHSTLHNYSKIILPKTLGIVFIVSFSFIAKVVPTVWRRWPQFSRLWEREQ